MACITKRAAPLLITILLMTLLAGCSPQEQLNKRIDKDISSIAYLDYPESGFHIKYPDWPATEQTGNGAEISVSKGYCTVLINTEDIPPEQWYSAMADSVDSMEGSETILKDDESRHMIYSTPYLNFTMISDTRIYSCNSKSHAAMIVCISEINDKTQQMKDTIFSSAACDSKTLGEPSGMKLEADQNDNAPVEQTSEYETLDDGDFKVDYPDWPELQDEKPETRELGVTKGVCSILADRHNALPGDIASWIETSISEKEDNNLISSSGNEGEYTIIYESPFENYTVVSHTKIMYCNYMSYITSVACLKSMITPEFEAVRERVINSMECSKEYEIPTKELLEERKTEVLEDEPEAIGEIEDEIVKTDAGEEFGIDAEIVVYFINSNQFFTKIMKDFPKANLVFEDTDNNRELQLKVTVSESGKIELVEDGQHEDPDVKLTVPLRDALNIFGNAQNINPLTLIGFAVNVRTDPSEIKEEVIKKVLRGEYN